jgi:hypothetical protein
VAKADLIVTAAHVIAGQSDTVVELQSGGDSPPDGSRSIVTTTLRCCAHGTCCLRPLPMASASRYRRGGVASRRTAVHRDARANRAHVDGPGGRRLRDGACATQDYFTARTCQAWGFRGTGGRCARGRPVDDLRGSSPLGRRFRRPGRRRECRSRRRGSAGVDRRLRSLVREQLENAQRAPERGDQTNA